MKLIELVTITIVMFVLFAFGVKAVQHANENATQMTCQHNIAQVVYGNLNYEDVYGYLPPARTVNNHPSYLLHILPYVNGHLGEYNLLKENHLFDKDFQGVLTDANATPVDPYNIGDRNTVGVTSIFSGNPKTWYRFTMQTSGNPIDAVTKNDGEGINWSKIHAALANVPEYRCPNRQSQPLIKKVTADTIYSNSFQNLKFDSDLYEQSCMRGVVSDYAVAYSKRPLVLDTYKYDKDGNFANITKSEGINKSTTFFVGEKYIPNFALTNDTPISNMWNGGLHRTHATINAFNSSMRYINLDTIPETIPENTPKFDKNGVPIVTEKHPIAVKNNEVESELSFLIGNGNIRYPSNFQTGEYLWGSVHPETLSVGMLDGSVKKISKNIDANIFNKGWIPKPAATVFID
ncbi:MAG: DUF1559 domain-containing protein [Planctomycetaceae bacterium]|jgi:hypothetical protein|nr:DUF1559 domain-containing protein [Planctomycetaceae bacterium]